MRISAGVIVSGVLAVLVLASPMASATPITVVDTGAGPANSFGLDLSTSEFLAAEFSVGSPVTVTSAEGWINVSHAGTLNVKFYSDGGDIPGSQLFSASPAVGTGVGWRGATGLNWLLAVGTYWIAFEVPASGGMAGYMTTPAPSPLANGAFFDLFSTPPHWVGYDAGIGVRILGDTGADPVPEPATLLLLGTGLAALAVRRRFKRRA